MRQGTSIRYLIYLSKQQISLIKEHFSSSSYGAAVEQSSSVNSFFSHSAYGAGL
jgi:hypothetical protein